MRLSRHPRLSRILFVLAVFQMFAPSVAAIADAWRLDQREVFAHMESETSSSCVVVHAHDCALCSVASGPTGTATEPPVPVTVCRTEQPFAWAPVHVVVAAARTSSAPRAPPISLS